MKQGKHGSKRGWRMAAAVLVAGTVLAGPMGLGMRTASAASIKPPSAIANAGKVVFCSDVSYPPEEFFQGTKTVGSDIDIAADIARRMGVKLDVANTGFDGIIAALLSNKCDAIISGMNDTAERRKQINFVDYINVGQSLMVQKGNPTKIKGLNDLAGKTVGVEVGTTNYQYLKSVNDTFKKQGKAQMTIVTYPKDTDGATSLHLNKLDVYATDSPVVAYYVVQHPTWYEIAGPSLNPIPVGIGVVKSNTQLRDGIKQAIKAMYKDGTMKRILAKWKLSQTALKM